MPNCLISEAFKNEMKMRLIDECLKTVRARGSSCKVFVILSDGPSAWETFLSWQSSGVLDEDSYVIPDVDIYSDWLQTFLATLKKKEKVFLADDSSFWKPLSSIVNGVTEAQLLLLTINQALYTGSPETSEYAANLVLTLYRLPHAIDNYFTPSVHTIRILLSKLQGTSSKRSKTLGDGIESDDEDDELSAKDDDSRGAGADNGNPCTDGLLRIIETFLLKSVTCLTFSTECGLRIVRTVLEALFTLSITCQIDGFPVILKFFRLLQERPLTEVVMYEGVTEPKLLNCFCCLTKGICDNLCLKDSRGLFLPPKQQHQKTAKITLSFLLELIDVAPILLRPSEMNVIICEKLTATTKRQKRKKVEEEEAPISSEDDEETVNFPVLEIVSAPTEIIANDPIVALLCRLCVCSSDKKDAREFACHCVSAILDSDIEKRKVDGDSTETNRSTFVVGRFVQFLLFALECNKASIRSVSAEVAAVACLNPDRLFSSKQSLLLSFLRRLSDPAPVIRARVLELLGTLLVAYSRSTLCSEIATALLGGITSPCDSDESFVDYHLIVERSLNDERQIVRRSLVVLLSGLFEVYSIAYSSVLSLVQFFNNTSVSPSVFSSLICDPSVLVRSRCVTLIADILSCQSNDPHAQWLFITLVPAAIQDPEKMVVEKVLDSIATHVFCRIGSISNESQESELQDFLNRFDSESSEFLCRAPAMIHKSGGIPATFLKKICSITSDLAKQKRSESSVPLLIYKLIVELIRIDKKAFVPWQQLSQIMLNATEHPDSAILHCLADCILIAETLITPQINVRLNEFVFNELSTFTTSLYLIPVFVKILAATENKDNRVINTLSQECNNQLMNEGESPSFAATLTIIGCLTDNNNFQTPPNVISRIHCLTSTTYSEKVRCCAILSLGKICRSSEVLAKKNMTVFLQSLGSGVPDIIRCNALVVMGDLSIRYTNITGKFLQPFSNCLGSSSAIIRRQCLTLMALLVGHDYLKPKGIILPRMISCLADSNLDIQKFTKSVLSCVVHPRQENFIQNNFLDLVCFLNSWGGHPSYNIQTLLGSGGLKSPFCFLKQPAKRELVYKFYLERMTDRDRHEISRKIVHSFLSCFIDEDSGGRRLVELPKSVDESSGACIHDVLCILSCSQMKITFEKPRDVSSTPKDDMEEMQQTETNRKEEENQTAYESGLLKRNLAYQILPTLLSLKRILEDKRSVFLRDMSECLSALLYDYRHDIRDILFHDPMLAKQLSLEFDSKNTNKGRAPLDLDKRPESTSQPSMSGSNMKSIRKSIPSRLEGSGGRTGSRRNSLPVQLVIPSDESNRLTSIQLNVNPSGKASTRRSLRSSLDVCTPGIISNVSNSIPVEKSSIGITPCHIPEEQTKKKQKDVESISGRVRSTVRFQEGTKDDSPSEENLDWENKDCDNQGVDMLSLALQKGRDSLKKPVVPTKGKKAFGRPAKSLKTAN